MDYQEVIKHCEKRRDQAAINPLTPEQYEKAILEMAHELERLEGRIADMRAEDYRRNPY